MKTKLSASIASGGSTGIWNGHGASELLPHNDVVCGSRMVRRTSLRSGTRICTIGELGDCWKLPIFAPVITAAAFGTHTFIETSRLLTRMRSPLSLWKRT